MLGLLHATVFLHAAKEQIPWKGFGTIPRRLLDARRKLVVKFRREYADVDDVVKKCVRVEDVNGNVTVAREGEIFQCLFNSDDAIDRGVVDRTVKNIPIDHITSQWRDVDQYNLLDKAILYDNPEIVNLILEKTKPYANGSSHPGEEYKIFSGTVHLAALLGSEQILSLLLEYDRRLIKAPGAVKINQVIGPLNHLFYKQGYSSSRYSEVTKRLNWVATHVDEPPVHYSIAGDHVETTKRLIKYYQSELEEEEKINMILTAVSCCSLQCLEEFYTSDPKDIYLRDKYGRLLVGYGLTHGIKFLEFLMAQGLVPTVLNSLDKNGEINALHQFYSSLTRSDYSLSKYTDVSKMTTRLLNLGVDVSQQTDAFKSHNIKDTPLHLLLDQINMIVCRNKIGLFVPKLNEVQKAFDNAVIHSVMVILGTDFKVEDHIDNLLRRLFSNRNHITRYKLSLGGCTSMADNAYGLENVYVVTELLLKSKERLGICSRRREFSPLLCLVDGLRVDGGPACLFDNQDISDVFEDCVDLLLACGDNPNVYPLYPSKESYCAPPLIHLIDRYTDHYCSEIDYLNIPLGTTSLNSVCRVAEKFIRKGAKFMCHLNVRGSYVQHGVFDSLVLLMRTIHRGTETCLDKDRLAVLKVLLQFFLQQGAEDRVYDYLFHKISMGAMLEAPLKYSLLYHFLLYLTHCILYTGSTCSLLQCEDYHAIMRTLLHHSNHVMYYNNLEGVTGTIHLCLSHPDWHKAENTPANVTASKLLVTELLSLAKNPRQLQHICRVALYKHLRMGYIHKVNALPLPTALKEFLVEFDRL